MNVVNLKSKKSMTKMLSFFQIYVCAVYQNHEKFSSDLFSSISHLSICVLICLEFAVDYIQVIFVGQNWVRLEFQMKNYFSILEKFHRSSCAEISKN